MKKERMESVRIPRHLYWHRYQFRRHCIFNADVRWTFSIESSVELSVIVASADRYPIRGVTILALLCQIIAFQTRTQY